MPAPHELLRLVEQFERNRDAYRSGAYNETQLRREFLDPFFETLGWDVDNRQGYAERYKDVVHEDAIRVGGATRAPDYCFRIGGQRKFFVEAKKPSVNLHDDISPAFQLRRYAWSAKLPLSILTDFEELAVYDCRRRPDKSDKASTGRLLYFTYTDYPQRWEEIAGLFSREAVLKGAFDKYAEAREGKRGTAEVDNAFLAEIEGWREALARNLALRNPSLSQRALNFAVQVTIDRMIFLRICEDRGIEPYGQLQALQNGSRVYPRLLDLFHRADDRYNSGLFHFQAEPGRAEPPDDLMPGLALDDKPLKEILRTLYYPDSPYEFSVLPADILGQVYERFLGKVIRLTAGHQAKVEEKPEVRKAGGVYYTPTYIVDYIVRNTVGKLLEGKRPEDVAGPEPDAPGRRRRRSSASAGTAAPPLRVLDPACGSGSFLIGAYQFLLDWYRDRYVEDDPEKWARGAAPRLYQTGGGEWCLTTAERKRILLAHVYGVDIDTQAVEVTKLSLLLKVLEGESDESLNSQMRLFQERALPDLSANVKCGNSLIGPDFYESGQLTLLDDEERYRINVFDWHGEFPQVFSGDNPGFDAVIGNPPYIRIQAMKEWAPVEVEFYKRHYQAASKGNYDIYVVFVEKGLSLLNSAGRLGFILPNKFFTTDYGEALRMHLAHTQAVHTVVDFGHSQVFQNATTYTCLLFLGSRPQPHAHHVRIDPERLREDASAGPSSDGTFVLGSSPWHFSGDVGTSLMDRLHQIGVPLLQVPATMCRGSSTGCEHVFCLLQHADGFATRTGVPVPIEPEITRRTIAATDFTRYCFRGGSNEVVIFPYLIQDGSSILMGEGHLRQHYPKAYEYLQSKKRLLDQRKQAHSWYAWSAPRSLAVHSRAQFLVPLLADRGLCAPMPSPPDRFALMAGAGFSLGIDTSATGLHPSYVLGLMNSRLLFWHLRQISNKFRGGWITCTKQYFGALPIRPIDFADAADRERHDRMVALVERMLELHRRLPEAGTAHEKALLQREIDATDRQIDRLVYDLYGLTDEEIRIVEEATAR